jgi:hypothetical protein
MTYPNKTKRSSFSWLPLLALLAGLFALTGCTSTRQDPLARFKHFRDADQADAVIKHDSWDYTFVLHPPVTEDGYRRILKAEEVGGVIRNQANQLALAVILVGWQYSPADHYRIGQRWNELLQAEGFQRVVCIKTVNEKKLNGSPVVYDSAVAGTRVAAVTP